MSAPASPAAAPALSPEQQAFANALAQLKGSERGRAAAVRFRKLLEADNGYAMGLDQNNWEALEALVRACRVFGAYNVRELLPRR